MVHHILLFFSIFANEIFSYREWGHSLFAQHHCTSQYNSECKYVPSSTLILYLLIFLIISNLYYIMRLFTNLAAIFSYTLFILFLILFITTSLDHQFQNTAMVESLLKGHFLFCSLLLVTFVS